MSFHAKSKHLNGLMASVAVLRRFFRPYRSRLRSPRTRRDIQPFPVSVATVEPHEADTWDEFSGRLEAIERVDLRPRVAGQIVAIHFREGAMVKAGDSLVTIDPAPYSAEVDRLNGVVAAAQAQVVFTKADVARARQIIGSSALSERELDTRANAYDAAVRKSEERRGSALYFEAQSRVDGSPCSRFQAASAAARSRSATSSRRGLMRRC